MTINDYQRGKLEIALGKLHEVQELITFLASNTADGEFGAQMDMLNSEIMSNADYLRKAKDESELVGYSEYRKRFLEEGK